MKLCYSFLLLLLVLSGFFESLQHAKPSGFLHTTRVTVCSKSGTAQLGILAPVLSQNEVYRTVPPQNEVYRNSLLQMFINVALEFQLMRKQAKKSEEAVLTSMAIAKHNFPDRSLRRLKLTLRLEHSIYGKERGGSIH